MLRYGSKQSDITLLDEHRKPMTHSEIFLVLGGWLGGLAMPVIAAPAPQKPNVVFILADDLGYYDLSLNGSKFCETPNIDALAKHGMQFAQAYSASPLCSPTRSSILTGLYPARTGITLPECHLSKVVLEKHLLASAPPGVKALPAESLTRLQTNYYTLAQAFKADGYVTGHFGKWHLGPEPYSPLQHGFDVDIPHTPASGPGPYKAPGIGGFFHPFNVWKNHGQPGDHLEDDLCDEAVKFIEQNKEHPFFLNYWAFEVHAPWQAKDRQIEKYRAKADPAAHQRNPVYGGMVESLDEAVGRLMAALKKAGVLENTIIVFTSDNGPYFRATKEHIAEEFTNVPVDSAYPLRFGKGTVYEGGTRVPLIVIWPGRVQPGAVSQALAQSTDLFPTFADMLGWKLPAKVQFDGVSLRPVLEKNQIVRDEIFCHFPHNHPASSIRQGDWKLIRFFCDNADQADRYELYNLADDRGEEHDVSAAQPDRVKTLAARLDQYLQKTNALIPQPNPKYNPASKQTKAAPVGSAKRKPASDADPNP